MRRRDISVLLLIDIASLLDEYELGFVRLRKMAVDVLKKCCRGAVGEAVVGTDEERTRVRDARNLRPVAAGRCMDVVQRRPEPVGGGCHGAVHPAHEREGEHLAASALRHERGDGFAFLSRHAACHVIDVRWAHQNEMLHARIVVA